MKYYTDGENFYRLGKKDGFYWIYSANPKNNDTEFSVYESLNTHDYGLMQDKNFAQNDFMRFVKEHNLYLAEMPALAVKQVTKRVPKAHKNGRIMISSPSLDSLENAIHRDLGWSSSWVIDRNTLLFRNDTVPQSEVDKRNREFFVTPNKQTMRYQLRMDLDALNSMHGCNTRKMRGIKTAVCGRNNSCKSVIRQLENSVRKMI